MNESQTLKRALELGYRNYPDMLLSNGRIVSHRPMMSGDTPNGATDAFMGDGGGLSQTECDEHDGLIVAHCRARLSDATQ